jgi:imidazolonepropionase
LKMLRVGRRLGELTPLRIRNTLLAGHVYPADIDREDYVDMVCNRLLPAAYDAHLLDSIEVYCEETIGLSLEDSSTILETAYRKKIPTRLQTDHLSDSAGAALAPSFYAKAAAHLNFTDEIGVQAMASAATTAVLLPGAYLELAQSTPPPVALLRRNRVRIAVATGCNPGTSPLANPLTAAHLACVLFGLSPFEALHGLTTVAARVLSLDDGAGSLAVGSPADLAVWDAEHPEELIYWLGAPLWHAGWAGGMAV